MTSIFDNLFADSARTTLFEYFGEQTTVSYSVGATNITGIIAIVGHKEVVEVEAEDGTIRKIFRRTLKFTTDQASKWKGIPDPQFKGTFTVEGLEWRLENRDAQAVEGISPSMISVNVVRKMATNKGQRNLRGFS